MPVLPTIPENIVVHLGGPDTDAMNVTVPFSNYIKNVASSEVYPTWPEEALKANILAEISVALNRVYTGFYRNSGKEFDITSSPAYDQTFVYQMDIYENISRIVDEIFNSYIRREGSVEPLFASFCDGIEITCSGLTQWGSVDLANQGLGYEEILRRFYGDNIEIVKNVPIDNIRLPAPETTLAEGDTGPYVELVQIRLNRISSNFPGIPKIERTDGFFDASTKEAVKKFQEVFDLTPDGIVGRATWNRITYIYNSVKKLYSISSEGLKLSELETTYPGELREGDVGEGVFTIQYYLAYIALFVPNVLPITADGSFGEKTRESVKSYQKAYSLNETGIVDEITWDSLENTYFTILRTIPYSFEEGLILPYPGRVLRVGITGDDVLALQEYLNYISNKYPEIGKITPDGVYGEATARAVSEFKRIFDLPGAPDRVNAVTWNSITNIYDDLYIGNIVREDQFPGYSIGAEG